MHGTIDQRRRVWLTIGVISIVGSGALCDLSNQDSTAYAAEPGATKVAAKQPDNELVMAVRKQVRLLADRELATRDSAEQDLLALGHKILDLLPPVTDRMPEEVKHRLTRIRQKLEAEQAEAALKSTTLTLSGTFKLSALCEEIKKQTGNSLVDMRGEFGQQAEDEKVKVDWKAAPFWPALDGALDQVGLTTYHFRDDGTLGIVALPPDQGKRTGRAFYSGPFRFEATRVEAIRNLRLPEGDGLKVTIEMSWEPRLAPLAVTELFDKFSAADDKEMPLEAAAVSGVAPEIGVNPGTSAVELDVTWQLPPRSAEGIAKLQGAVKVLVPGRVQEFRFEELAKAEKVEQRVGSVVVALDEVRQNNELWQAFVRVKFDDASNALESHRGWYYQNDCFLVDAKGARIEYAAFDRTRETPNEFGLGYLFDAPEGLKGLTLVYQTPAAIMNVPVEFTLSDLPLP